MWYALAAAVACFGLWLYRRRAAGTKFSGRSYWLLLGSGTSWSMRKVKKEGFMLYDGPSQFPISDCVLADVDSKFGSVYVLAASSVVLVDYEQFSRIKETAVKGAIFKPSGDIMTLLTMVGAVLVICSAIYSYTQSSAINATLVQQQAQINKVLEIVSKPMVIAK